MKLATLVYFLSKYFAVIDCAICSSFDRWKIVDGFFFEKCFDCAALFECWAEFKKFYLFT